MAELINANSELDAYLKLICLIESKGYRSSRYLEVTNCLLSIPYSESSYSDFLSLKQRILKIIGGTAKSAEIRAKRVFEDTQDRLTKPSYRKRLIAYEEPFKGEIVKVNQIDNIIHELLVKPLSSTLVFNFYRPQDTFTKKRQGYVPCPISGDFKFRKNSLQLSVFFRSQDVLNFFFHDVYYFRKLQSEVLEEVKRIDEKGKFKKAVVGELSFHYARVFYPLSMEWTPRNYINKPQIMEIIKKLKEELSDQIEAKRTN